MPDVERGLGKIPVNARAASKGVTFLITFPVALAGVLIINILGLTPAFIL
ncbi:MAG: hypothetical protein ABJE63_11425 [Lentilitoribacter sp.]